MLTTARILVAKPWKKESLPDIMEWESKCWYIITMNRLTAIINYKKR